MVNELNNSQDISNITNKFVDALIKRDLLGIENSVEEAIKNGFSAHDIYINVFGSSQAKIGEMWHEGLITSAMEHFATESTLAQMIKVSQSFSTSKRNGFKVIVACVEGNLHSFGARIVADFLRLDGWEVEFLGADTASGDLIEFAQSGQADLIALAVSLDEQIDVVEDIIHQLNNTYQKYKAPSILLGGVAPSLNKFESYDNCSVVYTSTHNALIEARRLVGLTYSGTVLSHYLVILGKKVHELRKAKNWSQSDLASKCGLDRTYISAVEHGKQNLTIGAAVKLSDSFGIHLTDLLS
jgi:MerR family transcriptional regulator, light-induced transcriptional regulator